MRYWTSRGSCTLDSAMAVQDYEEGEGFGFCGNGVTRIVVRSEMERRGCRPKHEKVTVWKENLEKVESVVKVRLRSIIPERFS